MAMATWTGRAVGDEVAGGGASDARPTSATGVRAWPRYGTEIVPVGAKPHAKRCTRSGWLAAMRTMRAAGHAASAQVPGRVASQPQSVRQKLGKLPL